MTRVDFYVIQESGTQALLRVGCRLAEKAQTAGHRVYMYADDANLRQQLDELLWTFRQGSFVPHEQIDHVAAGDDMPPVIIGGDEPPADFDDIMINLGSRIPEIFSRFNRCLELVPAENREAARERYRFYNSRGYPLAKHDIQKA